MGAKSCFRPVLQSGTFRKMDIGYSFGNQTGNTIATRAYWSNHSFSAKVTRDIPHESRLEPTQWGESIVE